MALITNTNSYVTLDDAVNYFNTRAQSDIWFSASIENQERALITATSILDSYAYKGRAISSEQLLAFPRVGEYFDPLLGQQVSMIGIPSRVSKATYEAALHVLANEDLLSNTGYIKELKVSSIVIKESRTAGKVNDIVKNLIKPLLEDNTNFWWKVN